MGLTTVDEIFQGPWGIVASRRDEIESGHYGSFERIYEEEIARHFLPIGKSAGVLGCHESTARAWLREADSRYIVRGLAHLYLRSDVEAEKKKRSELREAKKAEKMARLSGRPVAA